jgi:hypothetical protein
LSRSTPGPRKQPGLAGSGHKRAARAAWLILRALGRYDRIGCGVKQVVVDTHLPERTVKRHIADLLARGFIQNPHRGHYVHVPDAADILSGALGREGVHGLVIHGRVARASDLVPLFGPKEAGPGRFVERVDGWRGRQVRVRFFPSTLSVVVYVPATRLPIPWIEMRAFREWLAGRFYPQLVEAWKVVELGLNVDYEGWRIEGAKAVTLDRLEGTVERMYQRTKDMVRHEVHDNRKHPLDQVVKILKEGSLVSQYERILRMELELSAVRKPERPRAALAPDAWEGGYG